MGAKRKLSLAAVEAICDHIAEGKSIQDALEAEGWKSIKSFRRFISKHEKAEKIYRMAREMRAELWAEELIKIADDSSRDYLSVHDGEGGTIKVPNPEMVARARLRVETRKWVISKHLPKTYGDKVDVNHGGGVTVEIVC